MHLNQRHTAFSKSDQIVISSEAISRNRDGNDTNRIRFDEVTSVQLVCEGHSAAHSKTVYRCIVKSRGNKINFSNAIYMKNVPEMDAKYTRCVEVLHKGLAPFSDRVQFRRGSNLFYYSAWTALVFSAILLVLFPVMIVFGLQNGKDITDVLRKGWVFAMIPMIIFGISLPLIRKGKSATYGPDRMPAEFLPNK